MSTPKKTSTFSASSLSLAHPQPKQGAASAKAEVSPPLARVIQIFAWLELVGGALLALILLAQDFSGCGILALVELFLSCFFAALLFSLSSLLAWVHQIKLNTDSAPR